MHSGELLSMLDSVKCDTESRSERGVQHYVIQFVNDLRQVGGFLHG
jgi:hypothetical protein